MSTIIHDNEKILTKFLLASSVSILGGFLGYKLFCKYKSILKQNEQIQHIRDLQLKLYKRSQRDVDEVS
jgi:hypothetical protein